MFKQVLARRLEQVPKEEPEELALKPLVPSKKDSEENFQPGFEEPKNAQALVNELIPGFDIKRLVF